MILQIDGLRDQVRQLPIVWFSRSLLDIVIDSVVLNWDYIYMYMYNEVSYRIFW